MALLASLDAQQLQAALNGPALSPPPGVRPRFDHPSDLRNISAAIRITCLVLATITLSMRMYTRALIIRRFSWVDCWYLSIHVVLFRADYCTVTILIGWVPIPLPLDVETC